MTEYGEEGGQKEAIQPAESAKDPTALLDSINRKLDKQMVDNESLFNYVQEIQKDVDTARRHLGCILTFIVLAVLLSFWGCVSGWLSAGQSVIPGLPK